MRQPKTRAADAGCRDRGVAANHRWAAVKRRTLIHAYRDRMPIAQSATGQSLPAPRVAVPASKEELQRKLLQWAEEAGGE